MICINTFTLFVTVVTISAEINEVMPKWIVRFTPIEQMLQISPAVTNFPYLEILLTRLVSMQGKLWKTAIKMLKAQGD